MMLDRDRPGSQARRPIGAFQSVLEVWLDKTPFQAGHLFLQTLLQLVDCFNRGFNADA